MRFMTLTAPMFAMSLLAPTMGCEEIRTLDIPAEKEIEVPGTGVGVGNNPLAPSDVFPVDFGAVIAQSLEQSFSTEGVNPNQIESMKLTAMGAVVSDPEENGNKVRHLGFIESMDFLLGGEGSEDPPVLVAESAEGAFDDDPISYDWELTGAELAPVVQENENIVMDTDVVLGNRPTFATTVTFTANVTVIVDPFGGQ